MIGRFAILGTVTLEALAVYAINSWLAAGFQDGQHAMSAVSYVGLAWCAYWLMPALDQFDISDRTRMVVAGLASLFLIAIVLRIEFAGDIALWDPGWFTALMTDTGAALRDGADAFFAAFLVTAVWLRTLYRVDQDIELETVPRAVIVPFMIITSVLIAASYTDASGEVGRAAAWFYGIAILTMALSQLALSGATIGAARSGGVVAVLLLGTAALALIGILLTTVLWGPISEPVGAGISWFASTILTAILTPPLWLLEKFFQWIFPDEFALPEPTALTDPIAGESGPQNPNDGGESPAAFIGAFALRFIALSVFVGLVFAGIAWFTRRRQRGQAGDVAGPQTSSAGGIVDDLRGLFGRRKQRSARQDAAADDPAARLYFDVLHAAEQEGHARTPSTTPIEFEPELHDAFRTPVTDEITRAFIEARYAGRTIDPDRLRELEGRWRSRRSQAPPAS